MLKSGWFLFAIAMTGMPASGVQACSMSSSPQAARDNIKARQDVRTLKGRFTVTSEPTEPAGYGQPYTFKGTIETKRRTEWSAWLHYNEIWVQCGVQFAPPADAEGTFWISRRKVDGRHEILLWEGHYLPPHGQSEESDSE